MLVLTDEDVHQLRRSADSDAVDGTLYRSLRERADRWSGTPGLTTPGGTMSWWHVSWERIADVAAMQRLEPSEQYATWLHEETLRIVRASEDAWIGPFFRARGPVAVGALETAHLTLAVSTAAGLCPDVFDAGEHDEISAVLRDRGQVLCRRFLDRSEGIPAAAAPAGPRRELNNWAMVLLNGYGTASAFLSDRGGIAETIERFGILTGLFEPDSYGESVQYWNYAASQLSHLHDVIRAYDPALAAGLDLDCYTRCVPWVASSHLHMKPLAGHGDQPQPRALNFGDSGSTFRPSADVLLHIAARAARSHPAEAGLARWLFEETYAGPEQGRGEGESFGFVNSFRWSSLLLLREAAAPLSPNAAGLDLARSFAEGTAVVRDRWEATQTVLGVHGSHDPMKVASHRHADQNSFILVHQGERIFVDPGHCCYRLETQRIATLSTSHNTLTFVGADGPIEQLKSVHSLQYPGARPSIERDGDVTIVTSDAGAAYPDPIRSVVRTWVTRLPHAVFIIDHVLADEPVQVETHFVLNNRDGALRVDEHDLFRAPERAATLTARRNGAGARLVRAASTDGGADLAQTPLRRWGYVHDYYHPEPNQVGQGREGSASIYTFATDRAATDYLAVHALTLGDADALDHWEVTGSLTEGLVISRDGAPYLQLRSAGGPVIADATEQAPARVSS
ncbi:heparinase II/III family protein [Occultella aeris]|uniref:Heparinase II/III-like protein n=1 Tax=Occultella aeris TaxID=2761496 RepID=A0A7M4DEZ0_9MICO|nr:heparinase II/III family protein [Occultella aeris]VZO35483.1 Heparinase II/III-like protein [Occultella aeris]